MDWAPKGELRGEMPKVVPEYKVQARDRIVEAAYSVFQRRGFSRSTMDDIAAELGVSKGALYLYFPSKAALLAAIQEKTRKQVTQGLSKLAEEGDVAEGLSTMLDRFLARESDGAVYFNLMSEASDPAIRETLKADSIEDTRAMRAFLQQLRANGRIPLVRDLDVATTLLISVLVAGAERYMLGMDRRQVRKEILKAIRAVLGS